MHPLDRILRGVASGALGTLAMDAFLYRRCRRGGGDLGFAYWESSAGLASWEDAPAPALVAKRFLEGALGHDLSPRYVRLLNNLTHSSFGLANGAAYGLLLGSRQHAKVWYGPPFGATVWASGYVVLPLLGVYEPIWKYDLETLGKDLSAHLVFGTATAASFCLLSHREVNR
jgi:hypothetical protein